MGADLPKSVGDTDFHMLLEKSGLTRIHQGKVRDTYKLPAHEDLLLMVATDRLSIFDFVLPALVTDKGAVLTAITVFWLEKVLADGRDHLTAFGKRIDDYLPDGIKSDSGLLKRAMIVKKLNILPIECVARGYLTGSGWSAYKKNRELCGHKLPEGLYDGVRLPEPIFTPTTKADVGHDEHVSFESVDGEYGSWLGERTLDIYGRIADYAAGHGIILADTKFEIDENGILADEVATPDSSRFWDREEWEAAVKEKRSPSGYDKQPVREWGKTLETPFEKDGAKITGIDRLDTADPQHLDFVHNLSVPQDVLDATTTRYRRIFELLSGSKLEEFQRVSMGIE